MVPGKNTALILISRVAGKLSKDNVSMLSAALAYYAFFSIMPLLIIMIVFAGFFFDKAEIQGLVISRLGGFITEAGAEGVRAILDKFMNPQARYTATAIGVISLFVGAINVFLVLQNSLNIIWETSFNTGNSIWKYFKKRFISLGMILMLVILFLALFFISTALDVIIAHALSLIPGGMYYLWNLLNISVFLVIFALIFAAAYKFLPKTEVKWNDVWLGAVLTSILFGIARIIIAMYFVKSGIQSVYGAAGAVVILLIWVFYSSYVFLLGAEFTRAYSVLYGSKNQVK
ncbi:MAG: hypothetical protein A2297_02825 [Elusimicrobia bacterium RIFOXYB2_FULL_48_7]|nr:MAG: hypothetical protein A2297_02825 [Elusimicrobia bacterium RIFOXYB2_FULL_48_7]